MAFAKGSVFLTLENNPLIYFLGTLSRVCERWGVWRTNSPGSDLQQALFITDSTAETCPTTHRVGGVGWHQRQGRGGKCTRAASMSMCIYANVCAHVCRQIHRGVLLATEVWSHFEYLQCWFLQCWFSVLSNMKNLSYRGLFSKAARLKVNKELHDFDI